MRHQSSNTIPTRRQDKYEKSNVTIRVKVHATTFTLQRSRHDVYDTPFTLQFSQYAVYDTTFTT